MTQRIGDIVTGDPETSIGTDLRLTQALRQGKGGTRVWGCGLKEGKMTPRLWPEVATEDLFALFLPPTFFSFIPSFLLTEPGHSLPYATGTQVQQLQNTLHALSLRVFEDRGPGHGLAGLSTLSLT